MMRSSAHSILPLFVLLAIGSAPATSSAATWGGFDATRLNYAAGVLFDGEDHDSLRMLIEANGDTVAAPTATLDAAYLSGVDVFYTSLLSSTGPVLSVAEQAALVEWVNGGGTLIAAGGSSSSYFDDYEAFTSPFGVTGWSTTTGGSATVVADHPLTTGVVDILPNAISTFGFSGSALELATNDAGAPFMVVLDPDTEYCDGGRVLVLGDHNLFDDGSIANADNTALATNMVAWAAAAFSCAVCGDGVMEGEEACDDGNDDETDACLSTCEVAACGDGFVWMGVEACDDGNDDETDACLSTCEAASCGDGFIQAGVETCDDGNDDDTDECPGSCVPASCGDGYVQAGVEACDDGNGVDGDDCNADCTIPEAGTSGGEETEGGGDTSGDTGGAGDTSGDTTGVDQTTGEPSGNEGTASGGEGSTSGSGGIETGDPDPGFTGGDSSDGDGCGCTTGGGDEPALPGWMGGLLLFFAVRRRR